ncbi:hypothetical protein ACHAW5_011117 [Stephanodiscus triporus]|uniref:Protein-tyrosine-phosphatase n=1 Tax=Stephanodiscus triporus TaxID=2934178 RepID=A0ABD3P5I9_9STRA
MIYPGRTAGEARSFPDAGGRPGRTLRPPEFGIPTTPTTRRRRRRLRPSPFASLHPLPPYHDASPVACTYDLTVRDCLDGLDRARRLGLFRFGNAPPPPPMTGLRPAPGPPSKVVATTNDDDDDGGGVAVVGGGGSGRPVFDVDEYEHFEQVENGDLNWIVSGGILAFAGPHSHRSTTSDGYCVLTPDDYVPYFRRRGVKLVIQLNKGCYDGDRFVRAGIRHVVHQYPDGSCPEPGVLRGVLSDMEGVGEDGGAFAVHCKAGLGRTGTCVGAYIMKHYRFTAREVIGYMRICRPGMVIGPQQHFLEDIERLMWQEGDVHLGRGLRGVVGGGGQREEGGHGAATTKEAAVAEEAAHPTTASSPTSTANAVTPRATADRVGGGALGGGGVGSHIAIVTPDGRPFLLPATPVVARRPRVEETPSPSSFALPSATTSWTSPATEKLSGADRSSIVVGGDEGSAAKAGKMTTPNDDVDEDEDMQEGDQANALLWRRLDQYQARHQQHMKK